MNAKFLEKLINYRQKHGLECAKMLLSQKIKYQFTVIGAGREHLNFQKEIENSSDIRNLLLVEARAAREYWQNFGSRIQKNADWFGRKPHHKDVINILLDIGYHYLTQKMIRLCDEVNLPTELGIFHRAQSGNTHPLAFDFIEPLRPIMVDEVLLKIIGKKKKRIEAVDKKMFLILFIE